MQAYGSSSLDFSRPAKRQKSSHTSANALIEPHGNSADRYWDYEVAWICALSIELAAARAVLDELHDDLPRKSGDDNTYTLGRVGGHNVVVACLPATLYGTNNAANVLTNLTRTFPAVRHGLMVGIGGGVPSKGDIRLGDIVVGTRVMQDDLGKMVKDERIERTGNFKCPSQALATAVSTLRAKHEAEQSDIPTILQQKFQNLPAYCRPTTSDTLFKASYDHTMPGWDCLECDRSMEELRRVRPTTEPVVHYGGIASGNQVMKYGTTRDKIAQELDVHCFEMEAAGLMDILPCLPIRGICDYSDSHKNKEWQRYAAAVAACYACEYLSVLPVSQEVTRSHRMENLEHSLQSDQRARFLEALKFDTMHKRKMTIDSALAKTCNWFLEHPDYERWLDPTKLAEHHGFMWIRGKPGVGKSTLMKFTYLNTKRRRKTGVVSSFFFHARGEQMEKSVLGMYRSLLVQLTEAKPDLNIPMDDPDAIEQVINGHYPLNLVKDILRCAILSLENQPFTCFVDALDECDEQHVMDMVHYFEELAEECTREGIQLRVCFSSRHYPYIVIRHGLQMILEHQPGHAMDMTTYIGRRLRVFDTDAMESLRERLLEKASGVFLWIVLVVDILNREEARGTLVMNLKQKLEEIPSDLSELFRRILERDDRNGDALLIAILWILCASRPLSPHEFYHAVWASLSVKGLVDSERPVLSQKNIFQICERYIISSTRGLAEVTTTNNPAVQFIHESVKDFLVKERGLLDLWPDIPFEWESYAHERLKESCSVVLKQGNGNMLLPPYPYLSTEGLSDVHETVPFVRYASEAVLFHANAAADVICQRDFLREFPLPNWMALHNHFEKHRVRCYPTDIDLLYILAEKGCPKLISTRLRDFPETNVVGGRFGHPLFATMAYANKESFSALLGHRPEVRQFIAKDFSYAMKDLAGAKALSPLSWAMMNNHPALAELLVAEPEMTEIDEFGNEKLLHSVEYGHSSAFALLIKKGANVNASRKEDDWRPLALAIWKGHNEISKLLIHHGADINHHMSAPYTDFHSSTPLVLACESGNQEMAKYLMDNGADINTTTRKSSPLGSACFRGHMEIARMLIGAGAKVNLKWSNSWKDSMALYEASRGGHIEIVKFLLEEGAEVEPESEDSRPLGIAAQHGDADLIELLIRSGASVNRTTTGPISRTSLSWAAQLGHVHAARVLINNGADVNLPRDSRWSPVVCAIFEGFTDMISLLIHHGAKVNFTYTDDLTTSANVTLSDSWTPLLCATKAGHKEIAAILIHNGANVNALGFDSKPERRVTPLSVAAHRGDTDFVKMLIRMGADVNEPIGLEESPLAAAAAAGESDIVELLISSGAFGGEFYRMILQDPRFGLWRY